MALSPADIESFIAALRDDAQLRDRVRNSILADDFLALPGVVRGLAERMDALTERMDALTERMDALTERMDALTARVEDMSSDIRQLTATTTQLVATTNLLSGKVGNLEGWRYEERYERHLATRLIPFYWQAKQVILGNYRPLLQALAEGQITVAEWDDLLNIDVVASAKRSQDSRSPEVLVAVELSIVIDPDDVRRAHRRAGILRKLGLEVDACVDGEAIGRSTRQLAQELQVNTLHAHELAAA